MNNYNVTAIYSDINLFFISEFLFDLILNCQLNEIILIYIYIYRHSITLHEHVVTNYNNLKNFA